LSPSKKGFVGVAVLEERELDEHRLEVPDRITPTLHHLTTAAINGEELV